MKHIILVAAALFFLNSAFAQETAERSYRINDNIVEKFHVLKDNKGIRQGLYQAIYNKKITVASGAFDNEKKIGIWHFYDTNFRLIQNYDYTNSKLLYEAPELRGSSFLSYYVDKELTDSDKTTKPIKIGGRYYGYLPYTKFFKLPNDLMGMDRNVSYAIIELLISPGGRLADYKVHIYSGNYHKAFNIKIDVLQEDDKIFTPATVNGNPIGCRIAVVCDITPEGKLQFKEGGIATLIR